MSIVYLVGVILLALHLFVLQIVDIHKYREKGRMQRASHDLPFVVIFMIDMELS